MFLKEHIQIHEITFGQKILEAVVQNFATDKSQFYDNF